jgi:transcriptional regulator with XRE-family HTH domain
VVKIINTRHKQAKKQQDSIYRDARKKRNISLETAAEMLGVSTRTLAYYEGGEVPTPADTVVAMSKLYNDPLLMPQHCRVVCAIGKVCTLDVRNINPYQLTVQFVKEFNDVHDRMKRFIEIISDGEVQDSEIPDWLDILRDIEELEQKAAQLRFLSMARRRKTGETATAIAVSASGFRESLLPAL